MAAVTRSIRSRLTRRGRERGAEGAAERTPAAPETSPVDIAPNDPLLAYFQGASGAVDVEFLYADEESFTLMTPEGHMFAGWITFSAIARDGDTVAQAQVLMRASDPMFELGLTLGGHRQEDKFWNHTLTQVAAHFDHQAEVDTQVVCIDKRRQWSKARNTWQSSAIRSTMYMLGAPLRWVKSKLSRDRAGEEPSSLRRAHPTGAQRA